MHHPARSRRLGAVTAACAGLLLAWGGSAARADVGEGPPAGAADVRALRQVLSLAAGTGADGADAGSGRLGWRDAARTISDPALRRRVLGLRRELEQAAGRHARNVRLEAEARASGGAIRTEPGGPAWLRELVGDGPMDLFARLTELSFYQGVSAHDPKYRLNDRIMDDWLEHLRDAADLRVLNLENTHVEGPGLRYVARLTKLESLNLTLAPVTDPYLIHLRGLTRLRVLGLASTRVTGEGCRYLRGATHLVNLNCHSTPVNDAGLAEIGRLKSLERLEIVHTRFTDAGAAHLRGLVHLARLQLGSRSATGAALAVLPELPALRELDLHDLQPGAREDEYLGRLQHLRVLRLYLSAVSEATIRRIAALPELEELNLSEARLTPADLAALARAGRLRKLTLPPHGLDEEAVRALQAARPTLQILR